MVTVPQQNLLRGAQAKRLKKNWLPLKTDKVRSDVLLLLTLIISSYFPLFCILSVIRMRGMKWHSCLMYILAQVRVPVVQAIQPPPHVIHCVTFMCGLDLEQSPYIPCLSEKKT